MEGEPYLLIVAAASFGLALLVFADRRLRQNRRAVLGTLFALGIGCLCLLILAVGWTIKQLL